MTDEKTGRYLKYAFGETLLVVVGILIALQVNNWNEGRKERIIEQEFLKGLQKEMSSNRDQLLQVIDAHEKNVRASFQLLQMFDLRAEVLPEVQMDSLFTDVMLTWTYDPRLGKLNSIIMSGDLDLIRNEELKYYLSVFADESVDASELSARYLNLKYTRLEPLVDQLVSRKNRVRLFFDDELSRSAFYSDYQKALESFEIENVLSQMWAVLKYGLEEERDHLKTIEAVLLIIKNELRST